MTNLSSPPAPSFALLVQEIEATPPEHWAELLETLRQFRSQRSRLAVIRNPDQAQKNQAAIDLLRTWREEGDTEEQRQAWQFLETELDPLTNTKTQQ
jgi:hypothetical protein